MNKIDLSTVISMLSVLEDYDVITPKEIKNIQTKATEKYMSYGVSKSIKNHETFINKLIKIFN